MLRYISGAIARRGRIFATGSFASVPASIVLLESGSKVLLENGSFLLLE